MVCIWNIIRGVMSCVLLLYYDIRFVPGGYNLHTARLQLYVGAIGTFASLVGFLGLWDNVPSFIRLFNYYLFIFLTVQVLVFTADLITLSLCDGWAGNIQSQITFNPALYAPSVAGLCQVARVSYLIGFVLDFSLHAYFTYCSVDYERKLAMNPTYNIDFLDFSGSESIPVMNPAHGEPVNHMGPTLLKPTQQHGHRYGTVSESNFRPPPPSFYGTGPEHHFMTPRPNFW